MNPDALGTRRTRHPVLTEATRSPRLAALIEQVVPESLAALRIAEQAVQLARTAATQAEQAEWPTEPSQVEQWVSDEVARRRDDSDAAITLEVVDTLEVDARARAANLIEGNTDNLIEALGRQLQDVIVSAREAIDSMPPDVDTAADAVAAGCAELWKSVADLVPAYNDIRNVQRNLYRSSSVEFDNTACGDGAGGDPDARLYYHRNLPEVAPHWRGRFDRQRRVNLPPDVPWPGDATERLVWVIRRNAEPWCPTPRQIKALLAAPRDAESQPDRHNPNPARFVERSDHTRREAKKHFKTALVGDSSVWNRPKPLSQTRVEASTATTPSYDDN